MWSYALVFQLFSDVFVEDPLFLCEIAERKVSEEDSNEQTRVSAKEKNKKMMKNVARLMEVIFHCEISYLVRAWLFKTKEVIS